MVQYPPCWRAKDCINLTVGFILLIYDVLSVILYVTKAQKSGSMRRFLHKLSNWALLISLVNVLWSIIYTIVNATTELDAAIEAQMTQFAVRTTYTTRCVVLFVGMSYKIAKLQLVFVSRLEDECDVNVNHRLLHLESFIDNTKTGLFIVTVIINSLFHEAALFPEIVMRDLDHIIKTVVTQSIIPSCLIWLFLIVYSIHASVTRDPTRESSCDHSSRLCGLHHKIDSKCDKRLFDEVSGRLSINKEVMEEDELQQCEPADDLYVFNYIKSGTIVLTALLALPFCVLMVGTFALFELKIIPKTIADWFDTMPCV